MSDWLTEDLVDALVGTPVRAVITIGVLSVLGINMIWYAATRRQNRDLEQHAFAMGIVALASLGLLFGINAVTDTSDAVAAPNPNEPSLNKVNAIEAGLAAPSSDKKKLPDKKTRAPIEETKKEGVVKETPKDPPKKDDKKKPPQVKPPITSKPDDPPLKPIPKREDPDNPDTKVGPVVTPNLGPPNTNTAGNRAVNTGDPFWARLSADIYANFSYPAVLETKKIAMGCFYFNVDGTTAGWKLIPRSEDATLDDAVERALNAVHKNRKANPEPVPNHLLEQATKQWNCFPLGNLARQG